jgi:hypothetical protein
MTGKAIGAVARMRVGYEGHMSEHLTPNTYALGRKGNETLPAVDVVDIGGGWIKE